MMKENNNMTETTIERLKCSEEIAKCENNIGIYQDKNKPLSESGAKLVDVKRRITLKNHR